MLKGLVEQRLVALFAGGWLLLNFPLLALWDRDAVLLGVPLFPAALFIVWAVLIALLGWIVEHGDESGIPGTVQRPPATAGQHSATHLD